MRPAQPADFDHLDDGWGSRFLDRHQERRATPFVLEALGVAIAGIRRPPGRATRSRVREAHRLVRAAVGGALGPVTGTVSQWFVPVAKRQIIQVIVISRILAN